MKVTNWTYWNDNHYIYDIDNLSKEQYEQIRETVIKEIRTKGYKFTGAHHQNKDNCCPVIDDKYVFCVSMRTWGEIMYRALNPHSIDPMGYCDWAWDTPKEEREVFPNDEPN